MIITITAANAKNRERNAMIGKRGQNPRAHGDGEETSPNPGCCEELSVEMVSNIS